MYVRKCQKKLGFPIWCPVFQVPWMILRFTISCQKVASEWISSKNLKWFVEFLVVPKVQSWKSFDLDVFWKIFASPSSDSQGKFLKGFTCKLFLQLPIGAHNAAVWCTHQVYFRFSLFFASFHHQISSFPHHIFFISRTICFGHTTICFSSHFPNTVLWHISKELECNLTKYSLLSFIYWAKFYFIRFQGILTDDMKNVWVYLWPQCQSN